MPTPASVVPPAAPPVALPGFVLLRGVHRSGSQLPRHWHDTPTICWVERGRFAEYASGRALECREGAVHLMPAGETHWNRFAWGDTRGMRIDVDGTRWSERPWLAASLTREAHVTGGRAALLLRRVMAELRAGDDAAPLAVEGLLLELLALLAREREAPGAPESAWLRRARELVRDDHARPVSLGAVAREVGVHPVTLARAWRRAHGCSMGESVRSWRIERAARALLDTDLTVGQIAHAAGFCDQSHFTHAFRRHTGFTPGEWRKGRGSGGQR